MAGLLPGVEADAEDSGTMRMIHALARRGIEEDAE
jgi:hypothetical protein